MGIMRKEYGTVTMHELKSGKEYAYFAGRLSDQRLIDYIRTRAAEDGVTETVLCNMILRDAIKELIHNQK